MKDIKIGVLKENRRSEFKVKNVKVFNVLKLFGLYFLYLEVSFNYLYC